MLRQTIRSDRYKAECAEITSMLRYPVYNQVASVGKTECTEITWVSDSALVCVSGSLASSDGLPSVAVEFAGIADGLDILRLDEPVVTRAMPFNVPRAGAALTITGMNFAEGVAATLGSDNQKKILAHVVMAAALGNGDLKKTSRI